MWPDNDSIDSRQVFVLVVSATVGSGIVGLPAALARTAGPNAWLSVILAWAVCLLGAIAIMHIVQRFPRTGLVHIAQAVWGKIIAKMVGAIYSVYLLAIVSMGLRTAAEHVKTTLLPKTPLEVLVIIFLIVAVYLAREGIEPIARFLTILFPFIILPLLLILLALRDAQFDNVLPVLADGIGPVIQGSQAALFSLLGFEGLFVWTVAIHRPQQAKRSVVLALSLAGLITLIISVITILVFTRAQATSLVIALKSIVDTIDLPRTIIGHFDVVVFSIWITASLGVLLIGLYGLCRFLQDTIGLRSQTPVVLPLVPIIYLLSLLPPNTVALDDLFPMISIAGLAVAVVFPLFLWLWLAIRGRLRA